MEAADNLEERMLSGEPFTYGELSERYFDRLVDRTIQKLRRKGQIAFKREKGRVVWRAVHGKVELCPHCAGTGKAAARKGGK